MIHYAKQAFGTTKLYIGPHLTRDNTILVVNGLGWGIQNLSASITAAVGGYFGGNWAFYGRNPFQTTSDWLTGHNTWSCRDNDSGLYCTPIHWISGSGQKKASIFDHSGTYRALAYLANNVTDVSNPILKIGGAIGGGLLAYKAYEKGLTQEGIAYGVAAALSFAASAAGFYQTRNL